jgi:hypothetical protein
MADRPTTIRAAERGQPDSHDAKRRGERVAIRPWTGYSSLSFSPGFFRPTGAAYTAISSTPSTPRNRSRAC